MLISRCKASHILEDYLNYLTVIKGRSENTINEYRNDLIMFLRFVDMYRKPDNSDFKPTQYSKIDIDFIKSITINEMYSYISCCQKQGKLSAATRARRIVSIRQFWKYLKTKAHLIENNIAEELETPKIPKRIPKYLSLEDSMRLLIKCENSIRNHCILTIGTSLELLLMPMYFTTSIAIT